VSRKRVIKLLYFWDRELQRAFQTQAPILSIPEKKSKIYKTKIHLFQLLSQENSKKKFMQKITFKLQKNLKQKTFRNHKKKS